MQILYLLKKFSSNLSTIYWEMESNDQNENLILIDGENEICFHQWNMQGEILNEKF